MTQFTGLKTFYAFCFGAVSVLSFSSGVWAADSDECLIAESHARGGYEVYGPIFDKAETFLKDNEIDYDLYGRKRFYQEQVSYGARYTEKYCSDVYGGCGADKFSIDVSLNQSKKDFPVVLISPQAGAKNSEFGYVIVGKLSGVMNHKSCRGGEFINGHVWKAHLWIDQIAGNINQTAYVQTSLSQVGATIQKGYDGTLPSYEDRTLLIRIEDFGNGPNYERFIEILDKLPGSGVVAAYK